MDNKILYDSVYEKLSGYKDDDLFACIKEVSKWQRTNDMDQNGIIKKLECDVRGDSETNETIAPALIERACMDIVVERWSNMYPKLKALENALKSTHINMVGVISETIDSILNRVANNILNAVNDIGSMIKK